MDKLVAPAPVNGEKQTDYLVRVVEAFVDHANERLRDREYQRQVAIASRRAGFQAEVGDWMMVCFGTEIADDLLERGDRFIEEALELAQTVPGFTAERAHALVDYVFGRPIGERGQEVGGVMVTLAALCNTFGLSITGEADRELARIWTKVDVIRAKQAAKPTGSALPVARGDGG